MVVGLLLATLVAALGLGGITAPAASAASPTGTALAWGFNGYGELGDDTTTLRRTPVPVKLPAGVRVTGVAAGDSFSLAVTSKGRVLAWGKNDDGQLGDGTTDERHTPVETGLAPGTRATVVAAGGTHSLALARKVPRPPTCG